MEELASKKNIILGLPVLAVELATFANVNSYYAYHEPPASAFLLAVSFSILLVATAVLVSQDIGWMLRTLLITGGVILFGVQAASNVSEAFIHAQGVLPADLLAKLWGTSPEAWMGRSAFLWATAINAVGALYWVSLGLYYRKERRLSGAAEAALKEILQGRR
jgi:hypothetical protein